MLFHAQPVGTQLDRPGRLSSKSASACRYAENQKRYPTMVFTYSNTTWFSFSQLYAYAAFTFARLAVSTSAVKPKGSFDAISARILRSSSTPAFFKPLMNWL